MHRVRRILTTAASSPTLTHIHRARSSSSTLRLLHPALTRQLPQLTSSSSSFSRLITMSAPAASSADGAARIAKVQAEFTTLGFPFTLTSHSAVMTADEHKAVAGHLPGKLAKNLFAKDKKKQLYLIVVAHDSNASLGSVATAIGVTGGMRMAEGDALMSTLGVEQGSVSPLAVMNDTKKSVIVVLDAALDKADLINVHPLINTATVAITPANLKAFIAKFGQTVKVVDLGAAPVAAAASSSSSAAAPDAKKAAKKPAATEEKKDDSSSSSAGGLPASQLGITAKKATQFHDWYTQVVVRSELIEYYDISGCYIFRPWSFAMWEHITHFFDGEIKKLGVKNAYFPLFISKQRLETEKEHVEGFAPEVAWVTRSGETDLAEPIAVRPTSETIMYPAYAKWIRSHRDLPLKLNQWTNVVRWEFKSPTPFIRTREFLWQEGHTAFATKAEADIEVRQILDLYRRIYEELLAVPVIPGIKTETEKFAGGLYTTTVEAFIPAAGRGVQGATSHCLGQNFAKMFHITFEDQNRATQMVWQNSWGCTTRSLGVMIMVHADDTGLVLPPRVAPTQVVIVPIIHSDGKGDAITAKAQEIGAQLTALGVRVEVDDRTNYNPGWKYAHWEMKGVPMRIEIGSKDLDAEQVLTKRRIDLAKDRKKFTLVKWSELAQRVPAMLTEIQAEMLEGARTEAASRRKNAHSWAEFTAALDSSCTALAPHCDDKDCEKSIKKRSGEEARVQEESAANAEAGEKLTGAAKTLCIPFEQPAGSIEGKMCIGCGKQAKHYTLFGRSY